MKALIWHKNGVREIVEKPLPKICDDRDVIVKVKLSSICTSDIHITKGFVPRAVPETALGHEFVGEVIEVGSGIENLKKGDRVAANCITFCGECFFCKRGFINNCENGGWELGCRIDGCQAEYVRVPFGDTGLTKLPDNVGYADALFVGDILSSGYFGAELCEIKPDDTVAVIGSGPVGLCSMSCAKIFSAGKIIAIDIDDSRLDIARRNKLADYFINPLKTDVEKTVKDITNNHGADGVIEAAGGENSFETAWKIARPNAVVAVVAMYESSQILPLPDMYGKNLIFKTGGVDAVHCEKLLQLISENKLSTNFLITHTLPFNDILKGYDIFESKQDNCIKVAIKY